MGNFAPKFIFMCVLAINVQSELVLPPEDEFDPFQHLVSFEGRSTIIVGGPGPGGSPHYGTEMCSGVILNSTTILAAANCFQPMEGEGDEYCKDGKVCLRVVAGKTRRSSPDDVQYAYFSPKDIIRHDKFPGGYQNATANLAVVYLQSPLIFTKFVQPVQVAKPGSYSPDSVELVGRKVYWSFNGRHREIKKLVADPLTVVPGVNCNSGDDSGEYICAKRAATEDKTLEIPGTYCYTEYGSPLMALDSKNKSLVLVGLSGTDPGCKLNDLYQYTNLSTYYDWIESKVFV